MCLFVKLRVKDFPRRQLEKIARGIIKTVGFKRWWFSGRMKASQCGRTKFLLTLPLLLKKRK